jgi:hypothetical protein
MNCIEPGNRASLSTKGEIPTKKHGFRIDGYSCLRLLRHAAQVGSHVICKKLCSLYIIPVYLCTYYATPACFFSLQVENKPDGGIVLPAFILGAGMVRNNTYCVSLHHLVASLTLIRAAGGVYDFR